MVSFITPTAPYREMELFIAIYDIALFLADKLGGRIGTFCVVASLVGNFSLVLTVSLNVSTRCG